MVLSLVTLAAPVIAALAPQADPMLDRARRLLREVPIIDGHNDYPWEVRQKAAMDLNKLDMRRPQPTIMTDFDRLAAGGVGGQFWSVYVPVSIQGDAAVTATLEQIDIVHRMVARYSGTFELALTASDVERAFKAGHIASMIGMEGGHSINESLATLRQMHALGARYMTLTHSKNTRWADSATDKVDHHGLTKFGEAVVHEMNRLGMLVDLSHVSPETMAAVLRVTKAPVIYSHSSARALCDHPRNVPDDILKLVAANGGVVMANFYPGFIAPDAAPRAIEQFALANKLQDEHPNDPAAVKAALEEWQKSHPMPKATLSMVADHIDHLRQVAGVDHVGIGSDFDGIDVTPVGLEDVSTYPKLTAELLRRGWPDDDIRKLLGLNVLRVMRQAEAVARSLEKETPSVATIQTLDGVK